MKVYSINDGTYRYIVAARNQKEAANLLHTTTYGLRVHGCVWKGGAAVDLATGQPGKIFRQEMCVFPEPPWEPTDR